MLFVNLNLNDITCDSGPKKLNEDVLSVYVRNFSFLLPPNGVFHATLRASCLLFLLSLATIDGCSCS